MRKMLRRGSDVSFNKRNLFFNKTLHGSKERCRSCFPSIGYVLDDVSKYFSILAQSPINDSQESVSVDYLVNRNQTTRLLCPPLDCQDNEVNSGQVQLEINCSSHLTCPYAYHVFVTTLTGKFVFFCCDHHAQTPELSGTFIVLYEHIRRYTEGLLNPWKRIIRKEVTSTRGVSSWHISISTKAQSFTLTFLLCDPFLLGSLTTKGFRDSSLQEQLLQGFYCQLLFLLTKSFQDTLKRIPSFHLRSLLNSTDTKHLQAFLQQRHYNLAYRLDGIEPLYLPLKFRYLATCAINNIEAPGPLILGLILFESRVVTICLSKYYPPEAVHSQDLLSIILFLRTLTPVMEDMEHWVPLCLPNLDANLFLTLYVKRISGVSILYISGSGHAQQFLAISSFVCTRVIPFLKAAGCFTAFLHATRVYNNLFSSLTRGHLHPLHLAYSTNKAYILKKKFTGFHENSPYTFPYTSFAKHDECGLKKQHFTVVSSTSCIQVVSSTLLNPLTCLPQTPAKPHVFEGIHALYDIMLRLAKESVSNKTLPVQIELQNNKQKAFCVIGRSHSFFACIPLWASWSPTFFHQFLELVMQEENSLIFPFFTLKHYA